MLTLAQRIKGTRIELGLSREDLADAAGVTVAAVQAWESGETKNLKHPHLFAVAKALNVNPEWLALGEGPKIMLPPMGAYSAALARRDAAKLPESRKAWERIAAAFARATATVALAFTILFFPAPAEAAFNITDCTMMNRLRRRLLTLFQQLRTHRVAKA
jgi:transcriptional regulator with XRE-family HTH domain